MIFIYKITAPSGHAYIGISSDVARRFASHKRAARTGSTLPLHHAMRRYPIHMFILETIASYDDAESAKVGEIAAIIEHGTRSPAGYNISPGGDYDGVAGGESVKARLSVDPAYRASRVAIGRSVMTELHHKRRQEKLVREIEANRAAHRGHLRYVICDRTDGVERWYFRVHGRPKVRLPQPAWSNTFLAAYRQQIALLVEERANKSVQPSAGLNKKVSSRPNLSSNHP